MSSVLPVRNPRTGRHDYELRLTPPEELSELAGDLRRAQPAWNELGVDGRIAVLRAFKNALEDRREAIVAALSVDTGRYAIARQELEGLGRSIDRWCAEARNVLQTGARPSAAMPQVTILQRHEPYSLVGAISPWNFPLLLSFIDATPALLAGSAVIIKPSEVTPRFAEPIAAAIATVPELQRALAFVHGDGRTGASLIEHVDAVAFTGSVATGRKVAAAAAQSFIPAFLELGGKDPAIVLAGSDLERAATAILRASVAATGQACQSLERIYVHTSDYESFVAMLVHKAAATPLSYPDPHAGIVGPLIFSRQAETIAAHLEDALAKGASIETGGEIKRLDGGLWIEPTVLTGVNHDMHIMTEETFGPIMPVMAFDRVETAIRLANDTEFGLSAAVFGPTEEQALAVAERVSAGGVSVNDAGLTTMIFEEEKSAFKRSGMGPSRMGPSGLRRFLRNKALFVNRGETLPIDVMAEH